MLEAVQVGNLRSSLAKVNLQQFRVNQNASQCTSSDVNDALLDDAVDAFLNLTNFKEI